MAHLYKASMWQGSSGKWFCSDVEDLGHHSGRWWIPCRLLGVTPEEYVKILINEFHVSSITYSLESNYLHFSWDKDPECRRYKNWINKKAREANYIF